MFRIRCLFFVPLLTAIPAAGASAAETPVYRDSNQPVERRVLDLIGRMTLEEKIGQMNMPCVYIQELGRSLESKKDHCRRFARGTLVDGIGPAGGFFTLTNTILQEGPRASALYLNELQKIAVEGTRLGIPLFQIEEGTHGLMCSGATIFPEGLGLGSTFNTGLVQRVYSTAASEARAFGIHQLFTLVIEPNRDPRLGRNQEGYSEDPYLCAQLARAIVRGAQGGSLSDPGSVIAGLCHYPGQSEPVSGLEQGAMEISERKLRTVFLPPWTAGIKECGALGVMATYPAIDDVPAHGSRRLLTDILRGELGFRGIVLSEGGGFSHGLIHKGVAATQREAGRRALHAGVDVNTTFEPAYMNDLLEAVREGEVSIHEIDRAVSRILRLKFLMGLFENPYADPDEAEKTVHSPEAQSLALTAARESIVLLKNEGDLLPLDPEPGSIAVIGPNADAPRNQLGDYIADKVTQEIVTVLDGIRSLVPAATRVTHVRGCHVIRTGDSDIPAAVEAARKAQVAILVLGENERFAPDGSGTNGEHKDVASLDLTGRQIELARAVWETGTPTVAVLINGRPLSIRWLDQHVPAIVEAWLPGEQGGRAVAEVLFGRVNPSGRLPITIPRHSGQLPSYHSVKPSKAHVAARRGVGYVDMPLTPLYEFGHGLSYTKFEYEDLELLPAPPAQRIGPGSDLLVRFDIVNSGGRAGAEVVQLYINDLISSVTTPVSLLRGFEKVTLEPGERRRVELRLTPDDLSLLNRHMEWVLEPGEFEIKIGRSSRDIRLRHRFTIPAP